MKENNTKDNIYIAFYVINNMNHINNIKVIKLLEPEIKKGKSVLQTLKTRKTIREISDRKLSLQTLSDLLWAAFGTNRRNGPFNTPGRTAATASNSQEIDIYVAIEEGIYLYDPYKYMLLPIVAGDYRRLSINVGQQDMVASTPIQLIYVVDIDKLIHTKGYKEPGLKDPEVQKSYYFVATGIIASNVYLFAASRNLAAWFHNCDKIRLQKILNLRKNQRVLFAQTVGYPKNSAEK